MTGVGEVDWEKGLSCGRSRVGEEGGDREWGSWVFILHLYVKINIRVASHVCTHTTFICMYI